MNNTVGQAARRAAFARPQQPADSPAAALPVETLQHILKLAREDSSPPEAARTLKAFSLVCKLWHDVAQQEGAGELVVVANSQQADELRMDLQWSLSTPWQDSIRAVVIQVEREGDLPLKCQRVGDLLLALPRLERFYLELDDSLVGLESAHHPLGGYIYLALQKTTTLTHFHLELGAEAAQIDLNVVYSMLSCWPNLSSFTAPSLESGRWSMQPLINHNLVPALPTRLRSIHMGSWTSPGRPGWDLLGRNCNGQLLIRLLAGSRSTIQSLHLNAFHEHIIWQWGMPYPEDLGAYMEEVAPRLRHLDIRDGPSPFSTSAIPRLKTFVTFIERLTSIRTLTLGLGLGGVPSDQLFIILGQFGTLVDLTLVSSPHSPAPDEYKMDPQVVATFLGESRQLRSLKLPSSHCVSWSAEERRAMESAAEGAGVWLRFA